MGHAYRAVGWNRQKRIYDLVLATGVIAYLAAFIGTGTALFPGATAETLLIRALATAAFILLHVVLSIGPLARLDDRFLPLLYNRRHMGVTVFLLALAHAGFSTIQFHSFGELNPFVSILAGGGTFGEPGLVPFQPFGLAALVILALMAVTSHDFWLNQLTAPVWKTLHMLVYPAYVLLVAHVAFGILQDVKSPVPAVLLAAGVVWIVGLHLIAARREVPTDRGRSGMGADGFVNVCRPGEIDDGCARIVTVSGERVAVFRHGDRFSAISNVCQHQNGPLGEGRIVDGYVTCPWHGYQYCPLTGRSPDPFTETVPTFDVRLNGDVLQVQCRPNPEGTEAAAAVWSGASDGGAS